MINYILKIFDIIKYISFCRNGVVGKNVKIGFMAKIKNNNNKNSIKIGDNSTIHCVLKTNKDGNIIIGNNTHIRYRTEIESACRIIIGNSVIISNNVIITDNDSHPTSKSERHKLSMSSENSELWDWKYSAKKEVVIHDNVWIGRRAMILKGVTIGSGSIVASGSVVTKDVPPDHLCYGNPATIKKMI